MKSKTYLVCSFILFLSALHISTAQKSVSGAAAGDPILPAEISFLQDIPLPSGFGTEGASSDGRYLYVPVHNREFHVYDMLDIASPQLVTRIENAVPVGEMIFGSFYYKNTLYYTTSARKLYIYDCSNPANLILKSTTTVDGYFSDMVFGGNYAYAVIPSLPTQTGKCRFQIWDISNSQSPAKLSSIDFDGRGEKLFLSASRNLIYLKIAVNSASTLKIASLNVSSVSSPAILNITSMAKPSYDNSFIGYDNYFIVSLTDGIGKSTFYVYSTTNSASPQLIKSYELPGTKVVMGITDVGGFILAYAWPYDSKSISAFFYDDGQNEFTAGPEIADTDGWGTYDFVILKDPIEVSSRLNKSMELKESTDNVSNYYAVYKNGSPPVRVVKLKMNGDPVDPILTVSGSKKYDIKCPTDVVPDQFYNAGSIVVSADENDDWTLGGLSLEASGSGDDFRDLAGVNVQGVYAIYDSDNGKATFNFNPGIKIPAGTSVTLIVNYSFSFTPKEYAYDEIKTFSWTTKSISASPDNYPPGMIQGNAKMDSLIFARVRVLRDGFEVGYYAKINAATQSGTTADGDLVLVCDGTYEEKVVVDKSLQVKSQNGKGSAEIKYSSDYVVAILNKVDATIEGFTLSGNKDYSLSWGIFISQVHSATIRNNLFKNLSTGILRYSSMDELVISQNDFDSIGDYSIKLLSTNQSGWLQEDNRIIISNNYFSNNNPNLQQISFIGGRVKGEMTIKSNVGESSFSLLTEFAPGNSGNLYIEANEAKVNDNHSEITVKDFDGKSFIRNNKRLKVAVRGVNNCGEYTLSDNSLLGFVNQLSAVSKTKFTIENNEIGGTGLMIYEGLIDNNSMIRNNVFKSRLLINNIRNTDLSAKYYIDDNSFEIFNENPIYINNSTGFIVSKNIFTSNMSEVYIAECSNFMINSNTFKKNFYSLRVVDSRDGEIKFNNCRYNHNAIMINSSSSIKVNENTFIENDLHSLHIFNSSKISAIANTFIKNCTAILMEENCSDIVLKHNIITECTCFHTGINIKNSNADIVGNTISDNHGNGIYVAGNASVNAYQNNISGNDPAGLSNANPNITVNAANNYWGNADGPQSGDISGNVDVSSWLPSPVKLRVSFEAEMKYSAPAKADSILVSIQNILNLNDSVSVTVTDEKGWITGNNTFSQKLKDSTGYSFYVYYNIPPGSNDNNIIVVKANSLLDNTLSTSDTTTVTQYQPSLKYLVVTPDSVSVFNKNSRLFNVKCYDQNENPYNANISWSATLGTIDGSGMLAADSTLTGESIITAVNPESGISASVRIYLSKTEPAIYSINIIPQAPVVEVNNKIYFTSKAYDQNGFLIDCDLVWEATGGTITKYGHYTAGNIPGNYSVSAADTLSGLTTSVNVKIDPVTEVENTGVIPDNYKLQQNYPNPFNPTTTINYTIPVAGRVTLKVYDILGREVAVLVNREQMPGSYKVEFDAGELASGIYIYRIIAGSYNAVKKLMLIK